MKLLAPSSLLLLTIVLPACSSNSAKDTPAPAYSSAQLGSQQKVELGTVVSVKTVRIKEKPTSDRPYGSVGVNVGTGGDAGIHGSVDVATLGRIFSSIGEDPKTALEIIVKKDSGDTVAITQATKATFKKDDKVKILLRNNKSVVIH